MRRIYIDFADYDTLYLRMLKGLDNSKIDPPKKRLVSLAREYSKNSKQRRLIYYLIKNFDRIILMPPHEMEQMIKSIDYKYQCLFYNINSEGVYSSQTNFGDKVLKNFFRKVGHNKSCAYCNSQYTVSYEREGKNATMFQIDHIFPQKKYPYFSISLFNLVPSCANCNLNKGSNDFWTDDYFHPYLESMSDNFKFTIGHLDKDSLFTNPNDISDFEKVKITITNKSNPKIRNHNELFDLEGIYNNFNDIAQEIIELGKLHPASKRKSYLDDLEGEKGKLFPDKETLERIYLRVYPNPEDINKRPLSKFIQDIARFSDFYDDKL